MNLYADSIIDDLDGANHKCMRDYKNLLEESMEARSAIFKFSTERKMPVIIDYDGRGNYSVLPPIKEECSEEVLQELHSTSGESGSTYIGEFQVLTVTPYSEEDLSDTYDDEYVSSEQEESCIEDCDIQYVPVGNVNIPRYKTERFSSVHTLPKLEAKQGYTDLKHVLHEPNYYYERPGYEHAEFVDQDFYQYNPAQQFYPDYDTPLQEEEDDRLHYYDDLHNQQYTSHPKHCQYVYEQPKRCQYVYEQPKCCQYVYEQPKRYQYIYEQPKHYQYVYEQPKHCQYAYEQPNIYTPKKYLYKEKPCGTYLCQDDEIPHEYVIKSNTHQFQKPRCKPTYSKQYHVQVPYSEHVDYNSRAYFTPKYTTYYEKPPQYYYESTSYQPSYTRHPNKDYFGYSDYLQFQESGHLNDPYENDEYMTYPNEDTLYY